MSLAQLVVTAVKLEGRSKSRVAHDYRSMLAARAVFLNMMAGTGGVLGHGAPLARA